MILSIGAKGFNYPDWLGEFYPEDMPEEWVVDYYANEIDCVLLCAEELNDKTLLTTCLNELDESFYLFVEDSAVIRTFVAGVQSDSLPQVAYCSFEQGGSYFFRNFLINIAEVSFSHKPGENVIALLISSGQAVDSSELKVLMENLYGKYHNFSMVFVFFDGALRKASTIKLAQTLTDLMG